MKSPLHDAIESHNAIRKGHIPFWKLTDNGQVLLGHTGDVKFLVSTANRYLGQCDFNKMPYISFDHIFGYSLSIWMGLLVTKGLSNQLLKELREEINEMRFFHILNPAIPSRGKPLPHWDYVADMEDFVDPKTTAAYAFSQQLTLNGFAGLKRCGMKNCQKFFIGRPDAKWCSKTCGSKHRVTQKRKRDRNK